MSLLIQTAKDVLAELNNPDVTWPMAFTAKRYYVPVFALSTMSTLHVSVVPAAAEIAPLDRSQKKYDIKIDVAVQQRPAPTGATDDERAASLLSKLDELMDLTDAIEDHFTAKSLPGSAGVVCVGVEAPMIFSPDHLERLGQFTSVLRFAFKGSQ